MYCLEGFGWWKGMRAQSTSTELGVGGGRWGWFGRRIGSIREDGWGSAGGGVLGGIGIGSWGKNGIGGRSVRGSVVHIGPKGGAGRRWR